ncbi:MAG TPA: hypothetical protein VFF74_06490 [Methylophilaceae bacterium]|nr:hypothetical protein [Methylophilaceae bacterium]
MQRKYIVLLSFALFSQFLFFFSASSAEIAPNYETKKSLVSQGHSPVAQTHVKALDTIKELTLAPAAPPGWRIDCNKANIRDCFPDIGYQKPNLLSTGLSGLALIVSIGGMCYTFFKDKKSRLRSINDEFWIRKIISPIALEPIITELNVLASGFPEDAKLGTLRPSTYKKHIQKFQLQMLEMGLALYVLKLLDQNLYSTVKSNLSDIEDFILEYYGEAAKKAADKPYTSISRSDVTEKVMSKVVEIMTNIKEFQIQRV